MQDLQNEILACQSRVEELLSPLDVIGYDAGEYHEMLDAIGDVYQQDISCSVEQDVRLCGLRLQKVQKQWAVIYTEVEEEYFALQDDDEEYFSAFVDDARNLCDDIGKLLLSNQTHSMWSNGLAVYESFMESFGSHEGA